MNRAALVKLEYAIDHARFHVREAREGLAGEDVSREWAVTRLEQAELLLDQVVQRLWHEFEWGTLPSQQNFQNGPVREVTREIG